MKKLLLTTILLVLAPEPTFAGTGEVSFTPVSYKVPVHSVTVSGTAGSGVSTSLIMCTSTNDEECIIDFADQTALDAAAAKAATSIAAGVYSQGSFSLCNAESGGATTHNIYIKGTASIGGTDYYTTSESSVLTTNSAQYGYATIEINTCQVNFNFSEPFTVTDDSPVILTLFPMITDVTAMSNVGGAMNGFASCAEAGSNKVCLNYPGMVPYVGDTEASVQMYKIYEASAAANTAGGALLMVADSLGALFGGWAITFKSETSNTDLNGFGQAINTLDLNDDGTTYTLKTYGSNPTTETCGYLNFDTFSLATSVGGTHSSSYLRSADGTCSGAGTNVVNYTAIRTK